MSANNHRMTSFVELMFAQIDALDKTGSGRLVAAICQAVMSVPVQKLTKAAGSNFIR